jgi:hypothetical protein
MRQDFSSVLVMMSLDIVAKAWKSGVLKQRVLQDSAEQVVCVE